MRFETLWLVRSTARLSKPLAECRFSPSRSSLKSCSSWICGLCSCSVKSISELARSSPPCLDIIQAICVILRTKIAAWHTLKDVFNVLCTRDCPQCDAFGGFAFLPLLERCCLRCLTASPRFRVLPAAEVKKLLGISQAHLRQSVPLLHTIPGIYSMDESSRNRRMYIVAVKQVFNAFTFPRTSSASVAATAPANRTHAVLRYMAGTTLPYVNIESGEVQRGLCCSGCQILIEAGTTPNPTEDLARRDRVYSKTGFLDHFPHCPEAQKLWKRSKEGKEAVKLPMSIIRGGYFSKRDVVMSVNGRLHSIHFQLSGILSEVTVSRNRDSDASTSVSPQTTAVVKIARLA
ncbi:Ankyrin repeats (3 copies) family protein [Trichophyton interdigitale]|uniref:Ankyrin repeats (3 copies) family protein n=1 Tax=Trichophyton interdigitale TaxID=101480 RepID=A0A9P5CZT7_9EURO|nr:Ankyrin repeats (3 copies) family protein [Trichophyton interdigitale]KAF3900820.1 Ankyrin repeats (3 copies) family protein [Trichophyton interdigitale]